MPLKATSFTVYLEQPEASLAALMNRIRSWLDNHKIEPAEFKSDATRPGFIAFAIRFGSEGDARLFETEFVLTQTSGERHLGNVEIQAYSRR